MFSHVSGGIRSCWFAKVGKATSEKRRLRWVFLGIREYPLVLVVKSLANHRVILLLCLNSPGFRGYPGISGLLVVKSCQIACKSQAILALGSGFLVFSHVSGGIRSCWFAKVAKATSTSEKRRLRWVFVGIRGYPLVLVVKSLANHRVILLLGLNFLCFRGYPGVSVLLVVKSLANRRVSLL